ncbi:MAG: hypothetical protein Q4G58_06545 [bacterium]|nr:hypothetical protein [bacterium]
MEGYSVALALGFDYHLRYDVKDERSTSEMRVKIKEFYGAIKSI